MTKDTLTTISAESFLSSMRESEEKAQRDLKCHIKAVCKVLDNFQVKTADIRLTGSGDEGWVESVGLNNEHGPIPEDKYKEIMEGKVSVITKKGETPDPRVMSEVIDDIGYLAMASSGNCGWEINEGSTNDVSLDVKERELTISHCAYETITLDPVISTFKDDLEDFCAGE